MLRLIAASSARLEQLLICRRCLSAVAGAAATGHPALMRRFPQQPPLLQQLQHATRLQDSSRSFLTLSSVRNWFTEGPEAATPVVTTVSPPVDVSDTVTTASSSFFVQDAPAALQELLESASGPVDHLLAAAGAEPTFASLGLGTGFWPSSMVLKVLEVMHTSLDVSWWLCAITLGVSVRLIFFVMENLSSEIFLADGSRICGMHEFGNRIMHAEMLGNYRESLRLHLQMRELYPEFEKYPMLVKKFKRRLLIELCVRLSALNFVHLASICAIYKATSLPVDSFQQGGILWVSDLTCIDPYFLMPAAITALLMLNVHYYLRNFPPAHEMSIGKPLAYTLLPTFVFTLLINFPAANLFYFLSTGIIAQLLNLVDNIKAGKEFGKAREEVPLAPGSEAVNAMKRLREKTQRMVNDRDYQMARYSVDDQIQKTYRIRRKVTA